MTTNWTTTDYYSQERLSVRVANIAGGYVKIDNVYIGIMAIPYVAEHETAGTDLNIDLTELVRLARDTRANISLRLTDGGGSITTLTANYGTIDQDSRMFQVPNSPIMQMVAPELDVAEYNLPFPTTMIMGNKVTAEYVYAFPDRPIASFGVFDSTSNFGMFVLEDTAKEFGWSIGDTKVVQRMVQRQCGVNYVMLAWRSRTGRTKRHTWELVKTKEVATDTLAIQTLRNDWDVRKNSMTTAIIRLTNLTAYDVWYYSDIVTSNKVQMFEAGGSSHNVNVVTKSVDIPQNGDARPSTLEIEVEYLRYEGI